MKVMKTHVAVIRNTVFFSITYYLAIIQKNTKIKDNLRNERFDFFLYGKIIKIF